MVNPSTTRTTRNTQHHPTPTPPPTPASVTVALPDDHEQGDVGRLHLGEPIYVEMTDEEHRRAIAALGALIGWAAAHPECWQESTE
jgi:hypothetical protein